MEAPDLSQIDRNNLPPNDSISTRAIVTMAVSFALVLLSLASRLYSRLFVVKTAAWDDWTIILATVCSLIQLIFNSIFIHYGEGRHIAYLSEHHMNEAYRFSNLVLFPFIFCTAITKISIGFMVLRLTQAQWMRYYMYALMGSLVLVNGACIVILFAFCRPSPAFWDITIKDAQCWDTKVLTIASSIQGLWSIITDLICTSTPLVMVWKLRMGVNQKVAITILIGFGLFTTGCSIGRVLYYATTKFATDQTWTGIDLVIWTTLEANVGIFAANLPALGFLRRKIEEKLSLISVPALRYLPFFSSSRSSKSEDREMLPTIGAGRPRRKPDPYDSILASDADLTSASDNGSNPD
ncbi:hypothetical protein K458DRAFT_387026 [Lentithecium fluviatile CBS 122367]|uniref:Rhodopsin domain-containing protein n=1 Tax=Lentithecium fluviatile CBS 122367 TaxID=1168545 RepID=A0A6G1J757_9PLEO|nr:hypothetical protein K458DRAFT_387026 [Lentithecium fluviatile CBS 122367]